MKEITEEQMDELIDRLNKAAQDIDYFELGLPEFNRDGLYKVIQEWITSLEEEETHV